METVPITTTGDHKNRIVYRKKNYVTNRNLYSYRSDDLSFLAPVSLSQSYPPAVLGFRPPENLRHLPPLFPLPLPISLHHQNNNNSSSNNNIRISKNVKNRVRDHSLTPKKKSKNQKKDLRREDADLVTVIGPDPKDLISRVCGSSVDKFSGSVVFSPSPPPSSLPLPNFSVRPKLGCNTEAAVVASAVDAGATDSLRRVLRL